MEVGSGAAAHGWRSDMRRIVFWMGPVALASRELLLRERDVMQNLAEPPLDPRYEPVDAWLGPEDGVYLRCQPIPPGLPGLTRMPRTVRYIDRRYDRYFIELSGTYEDYLARFSGKSRQTLQRKVRKFHETFATEVREYRTPDEVAEFYAIARDISVRTYQEKLFEAGLPTTPKFHAEMRTLAPQGRIRAYLLFADAQPVAYLYCPDEGDGRLAYRYLGYDPGFAKHSPGTVLQLAALERLFTEKQHKIFDFTEGDGDHKRFFATHSVHCGNVFFLKKQPRLIAMAYAHHALRRVELGAERLVERLGVKPKLRRIVRSLVR